jgi:hypothetical protein
LRNISARREISHRLLAKLRPYETGAIWTTFSAGVSSKICQFSESLSYLSSRHPFANKARSGHFFFLGTRDLFPLYEVDADGMNPDAFRRIVVGQDEER